MGTRASPLAAFWILEIQCRVIVLAGRMGHGGSRVLRVRAMKQSCQKYLRHGPIWPKLSSTSADRYRGPDMLRIELLLLFLLFARTLPVVASSHAGQEVPTGHPVQTTGAQPTVENRSGVS